jgi:DNA-binding CsgD family transcriptional regulator
LLTGVQLARGCAWSSTGHFHQAFAELRRMFDPADRSYHVLQSYPGLMFLTEAAADAGPNAVEQARIIVAERLSLVATTPSPDLLVHVGYARAVLAQDDDADEVRGWAQRARGVEGGGRAALGTGESLHEILSPQELQITRLVAEGLSNRQVAERLYLSPRTIGSHLYRIFPKLGVTSRVQLVDRFRRDEGYVAGSR